MKKSMTLLCALALVLLVAVPVVSLAFAYEPYSQGYVKTQNGGTLNLRVTPSSDAKVLTTIPYGAELTIDNSFTGNNQWLMVQYEDPGTAKQYSGYVMSRYIVHEAPVLASNPRPKPTAAPAATPAPVNELTNIFNGFVAIDYYVLVRPSTPGGYVHMRWAPSKQMPIMTDYFENAVLHVIAQNNDWCQVRDETTGMTGFMMRSFLQQQVIYTGDGYVAQ